MAQRGDRPRSGLSSFAYRGLDDANAAGVAKAAPIHHGPGAAPDARNVTLGSGISFPGGCPVCGDFGLRHDTDGMGGAILTNRDGSRHRCPPANFWIARPEGAKRTTGRTS